MAIKVNLQDGTVQVGGDFNRALTFVKSFDGRKYDGATKTWMVPVTVANFCKGASLPIDILSNANGSARYGAGNHITKWGNGYSRNEWDGINAARKAEGTVADEFRPRYQALKEEFRQNLAILGIEGQNAATVISCAFEIEYQEEAGRIRFSSPERRAQIIAACEWYTDEWMKIHDAEQDAVAAAQEHIYQKYGIE